MKENNKRKKSTDEGKIFLLGLIILIAIIFVPVNTNAEEILIASSSSSSVESNLLDKTQVSIKSQAFEETSIIEFSNIGKEDINSFRIWLNSDFYFKSFKTERGWLGEKTSQGVIIFTSLESVKPGGVIKIGIKTDKPNPEINWRALDKNDRQVGIGQTIPSKIPESNTTLKSVPIGILNESTFRIIPEHPNAGDKIRVTGINFGASQQFEFYIDTQQIGTFVTDGKGYFMTTMQIPENKLADRSEFIVKDSIGNEKKISLRIGNVENKIPPKDGIKLTVRGIPEFMQIGDLLEISGTANPNSVIVGKIINPEGVKINTRTASVNAKGNWNLEEPILVPLDSPLGRYNAEITDGRETIKKTWLVESSKLITIIPIKLKFNPGEMIVFNGTALPNIPLELSLEDPLGAEKLSDIIQVDNSSIVKFEYHTIANIDKEGTWTLTAIQDNIKEFIYVGLGQLPSIPINIEFDKLSYKSTETAIISLTGRSGDVVRMLIVNPADKPKGDAVSIRLNDDGKKTYELPLKGFSSGIYTAVISKGNSKNTSPFAVGLQSGSGEIKMSTTKLEYVPNDPILILGEANENVIIIFSLFDPEGKKIKEIEAFTDKKGKISVDGLRIPSDGEPGKWKINAKSGSNFKTIEIVVNASKEKGMVVSVDEGVKRSDSIGRFINIKVINAAQTVEIQILGPEKTVVTKLASRASGNGEVKLPWAIPVDLLFGNYTITAKDAHNHAETNFLVK